MNKKPNTIYIQGSLEPFMTTVRTDRKGWLQLQALSHPMPAERTSREVIIAIIFSIVIHLFPALILWILATNRIVVEPESPSIGAPLFVSLTTLPDSSRDEPDRKKFSPMPTTNLSIKHAQTSIEPAAIVEHTSEAAVVVASQEQNLSTSDDHKGYILTTETTLSFDQESPYGMEWSFGNVPEFKVEGIETSIGKGVSGSGTTGRNYLTQYLKPSYGLEAVNRFEQVFGEFSEAELQRKEIEWRVNYIKKYEASLPPDCSTYYGSGGLLAIPIIIKDVITHNNKVCIW